ncbi:hypothetical protein AB0K09_11455 [Streptomyces sp. NPDC049577]|uniref:hypothetical protein n=1 Tax=Streptomyces sp. NPDC049577 TaxID=3155153 RepID=UPI003438FC02
MAELPALLRSSVHGSSGQSWSVQDEIYPAPIMTTGYDTRVCANSGWWLTGDLSDLFIDGRGTAGLSDQDIVMKMRAEESFRHAEYRLDNFRVKYDLVDGVLALKRAMQVRLEHLDQLYSLRNFPGARQRGWLGVLEDLGLVRQRMLRRMNRLRNAVEHDGAEPPSLDECEDYREVVWWFLKATSGILERPVDYCFDWLGARATCDLSFDSFSVELIGNFLPEMLSTEWIDGWIELKVQPAVAVKFKEEETPIYVADTGHFYVCATISGAGALPFLRAALNDW